MTKWGARALVLAACVGCGTGGGEASDGAIDDDGGRDGDTGAQAPVSGLDFERVPLELEDTHGGHQAVTTFAFIPGTNELLLAEIHGDVYHYELEGGVGRLLGHIDLSAHVYPDAPDFDWDCGLISFAFDPQFHENGYFYVGACFSREASGILRLTFDASNYEGIADSAAVIMETSRQSLDASRDLRPIHNVGQMGFDGDGYLWALFGDGDHAAAAADPTNNFGSLVRIVPDREPEGEGYAPAPGNAFFGDEEGSEDIYAYGFRSPWTGHYDPSGRWWVGDVGSHGTGPAEEINVVTAPGQDFGWPAAEGPCEGACDGLEDPIRHWDHSSSHPFVTEMEAPYPSSNRVGWVGVAYRGEGTDRYDGFLSGRVLYGEMCVGFVRAMELDETGEVLSDALVGEMPKISAWDQGADGYLYASTYGACESTRDRPDVPAGLWRAIPTP